ncbi:MAG TPA: winged helix-turn-helix domain-containing protein [Candidatus Baltobacteraceae bacterium]|nr:winged helix-turn-helix domain-containing protein [Candidatus Baltobacteraceae bacterium]
MSAAQRSLRYHAAHITLTPKELDLLILLAQAGSRPLTRDEIIYNLWPNEEIGDSALSQTVYRLRRTLARYNATAEYISTIPGMGYQFVAPLDGSPARMHDVEYSGASFHDYRRAVFYLEQDTQASANRAVAMLENLLQAHPQYVPAIVGLADAHARMAELGYCEPQDAYAKAKRLAAYAIRLDPVCGEAYAVMSRVLLFADRYCEAAATAAQSAVSLAPHAHRARAASLWVSIRRGESWQALTQLRDALVADPSSAQLTTLLGISLYFSRRFAEAHRQFADALIFDPRYTAAEYFDACCLAMLGAYDAADDRLAPALGDAAEQRVALLRGFIAARRGDEALASRCIEQLSSGAASSTAGKGVILGALDRPQNALDHLELAVRRNEPKLAILAADPLLDSLPRDARTTMVLQSMRATRSDLCHACGARFSGNAERFECSFGCTYCAQCGFREECTDCGQALARHSARYAG